MFEPIWVLAESVKAIHKRQIAEHGGGAGIRDSGLLESALAKPKNTFFYAKGNSSIPDLAAAYAYAIAKNHPFIDGNKLRKSDHAWLLSAVPYEPLFW